MYVSINGFKGSTLSVKRVFLHLQLNLHGSRSNIFNPTVGSPFNHMCGKYHDHFNEWHLVSDDLITLKYEILSH